MEKDEEQHIKKEKTRISKELSSSIRETLFDKVITTRG
jgi:hypothetical protein